MWASVICIKKEHSAPLPCCACKPACDGLQKTGGSIQFWMEIAIFYEFSYSRLWLCKADENNCHLIQEMLPFGRLARLLQ